MTPEEYRILFGEDPPDEPAVAVAEPDDPLVVDVTAPDPVVELDTGPQVPASPSSGANRPVKFTTQEGRPAEFVDPRPWWRKKRVQFPVMIVAIIILLAIGSDPPP